jgi:hypothetical protein
MAVAVMVDRTKPVGSWCASGFALLNTLWKDSV